MSKKVVQFEKFNIRRMAQYSIILLIAGMLGNIIFSLFTTDRQIFLSLQQFQPLYFLLAILLALVPWITNTFRLMIWTRFLGKRYGIKELFKIVLGADIGSAITPTAIGGGYVKAGMLVQRGFNPGAAASLMTLGSVEDGVFFLIALPIAFILSSCDKNNIIQSFIWKLYDHYFITGIILLSLVLVSVIVIIIIQKTGKCENAFIKKIKSKINKVWQDFSFVYIMIGKTGKARFCITLMLTAIQWICRYSVLSALLMSLGISVDPVQFFLIQWVTFSIMTLIPTPGAVAGAEASFYFIYGHFIPREFLGVITTGWRFLTFYLQIGLAILIIGFFYAFSFHNK